MLRAASTSTSPSAPSSFSSPSRNALPWLHGCATAASDSAAVDDVVQIEIDPASATLTDLVRLARLAESVPATAVLLAERAGSACWPGPRPRRIRLYFGDALANRREPVNPTTASTSLINHRTDTTRSAAAELACETLVQLLHTTRIQSQLANDKTPAARLLRQYAPAIERAQRPQTAAAFKHMMQVTCAALHQQGAAQLPWVRVDAAQSPTDCMLHWISALQAARQTPDGATAAWLQQSETAARRRWMQHDLTLDSVRAYFVNMQAQCIAQDATGLARTVKKIAARLPTAQQARHFTTRLNDNLYGRVFETRLMAHLIAAPAPGTLVCMQQFAATLLHCLSELPPQLKSMVAKELAAALVAEPRFWFDRAPMLMRFLAAVPGEQKKRALVNWLSTAPTSGVDCMATMLFAGQLSLLLKKNAPESAPWMWAADLNYRQVVQPASRRLTNMTQPLLRPEGGILLLHQRPAFSHPAMRPGMRATLQHRPHLDSLSAVTARALAQGLPYASGVSGSTNIVLHQAAFFRQNGIALDIRHLLLAAVMLLNGGHSLHEVLWMAHQLDQPLQLGLGLSEVAPEEFVSDYDRFVALFEGADRCAIELAVSAAWNDTIDYARQ